MLADTERLKLSISIPLIGDGIIFTGTGDLFAALFLAHSYKNPDLGRALEDTVATLQAVLRNTLSRIPLGEREQSSHRCCTVLIDKLIIINSSFFTENRSPEKVTPRLRELKIVQSKIDIENPQVLLRAKKEVEKF